MNKIWMFFFVSLIWISSVQGCTDFVVKGKDGVLIEGRSLEFAIDLETKIRVFPRNSSFQSQSPGGKKGLSSVSQYGYLSATIFDTDITMDGLNEEGLSMALLWLPGTQYMDVDPNVSDKGLDFAALGGWILGNFASIPELKKELPNVLVWGHAVPPLKGIPPVHVAVHDRWGNHLVIEFTEGKMKVYDNPNTVLTNYPTFDWHLINLQNYIGLNPLNAAPLYGRGLTLMGTGQGSGFFGMPGDWTPPSRFIRMSALVRFAKTFTDPMEGVCLAEHLLNAVDIPMGEIIARDGAQDYTQWTIIKDLTNRVFYFRSYRDQTLKAIDLKKIDFGSAVQRKPISISIKMGYLDVTDRL